MKKFVLGLLIALGLSGCLDTRNENLSGREQPLVVFHLCGYVHVFTAPVLTASYVAPVKTGSTAELY
jgi:hypothetical protein